MDVREYAKKWKNLKDKYVCLCKKISPKTEHSYETLLHDHSRKRPLKTIVLKLHSNVKLSSVNMFSDDFALTLK